MWLIIENPFLQKCTQKLNSKNLKKNICVFGTDGVVINVDKCVYNGDDVVAGFDTSEDCLGKVDNGVYSLSAKVQLFIMTFNPWRDIYGKFRTYKYV